MKMILKSPLYIYQIASGFLFFIRNNKTPLPAYHAMIALFCLTKGFSNDFINFLIALFAPYKSKSLNQIPRGPFPIEEQMIPEIVECLKKDGFYVLPQTLDENICAQLLEFAVKTRCVPRTLEGNESAVLYQSNEKKFVRYDYEPTDLLNATIFHKLFTDRRILEIAGRYFGAVPILDVIALWWSTDLAKTADSEAAQLYHFDMDRPKWLKVFVYLTDVTEESGPHCFIKGTHRRGTIPYKMLRKGYARLTDEEVVEYFGQTAVQEFTGKKGTVIIEDTRGLHKGKHVRKGERLAFDFQLSNSIFGTTYPQVRLKNTSEDMQEIEREFPRFSSNYST